MRLILATAGSITITAFLAMIALGALIFGSEVWFSAVINPLIWMFVQSMVLVCTSLLYFTFEVICRKLNTEL